MKTFYEMLRILEGRGWDGGYDGRYDHGPDDRPSFSRILGEDDDDSPFAVEVEISEFGWEARGSFWARGYVLDGSEPKVGAPRNLEGWGAVFDNPGKDLENLPADLRARAKKWADEQSDIAWNHYY